jgi:hypothetical protein
MARALVVFESMFGSTEAAARAVADGLRDLVEAEAARAGPDATVPDSLDLLVVGGPTHAFGMSRAATRSSAGQQGADARIAAGPGLREWLAGVHPAAGLSVAAFDTRIRKRGVPGSAARAAERRLRRGGGRVLAPAESFWVADTPGPLLDGEEERARRWGRRLAEELVQRQGIPA